MEYGISPVWTTYPTPFGNNQLGAGSVNMPDIKDSDKPQALIRLMRAGLTRIINLEIGEGGHQITGGSTSLPTWCKSERYHFPSWRLSHGLPEHLTQEHFLLWGAFRQ